MDGLGRPPEGSGRGSGPILLEERPPEEPLFPPDVEVSGPQRSEPASPAAILNNLTGKVPRRLRRQAEELFDPTKTPDEKLPGQFTKLVTDLSKKKLLNDQELEAVKEFQKNVAQQKTRPEDILAAINDFRPQMSEQDRATADPFLQELQAEAKKGPNINMDRVNQNFKNLSTLLAVSGALILFIAGSMAFRAAKSNR